MFLFGKKNTILVIGGIIFYHLLVGALCAFFIYRFLIVTYNAGVFILLSLFIGATAICDILAHKVQAFSRFLVRCKVDCEGVHCMYLGKKWCIMWKDVHVFGMTGFSSITQTGVVFLSSNLREKYQQNTLTLISNNRIAFSINQKRWKAFSIHMPADIKRKLEKAINSAQDCYFRR